MTLETNITEAEVVQSVKQALIFYGLMKRSETEPGPPSQVQRINTGAFKSGSRFIRSANRGTLDFEGYDNHGRILGLECKRPRGGRLSPEQKARIDDINRKGGVAAVVHSGDEAIQVLKTRKCL